MQLSFNLLNIAACQNCIELHFCSVKVKYGKKVNTFFLFFVMSTYIY